MIIEKPKRLIVHISGPDSFDFIQNIITFDVKRLKSTLRNCYILNPQGKIKFRIWIENINYKENIKENFEYELYCTNNKNDLFGYLKNYAELSEVKITDVTHSSYQKDYMDDYFDFFDGLRNGIIDTNFLDSETIFPSELAEDDCFDGVHYDKGCFIGQEVVSRIKHRQLSKKKITVFKLVEKNNCKDIKLIKNFELLAEYDGLLIVKFKRDFQEKNLIHNNNLYKIVKFIEANNVWEVVSG